MKCMTFAEWFPTSGLTTGEVAEAIGRDLSTVTELLAGRRWPSSDTALKLLDLSKGVVRTWDAQAFHANRRLSPEPRRKAA